MNDPQSSALTTSNTVGGNRGINKRSDDITLVLTFSGGGTRAAALSYGVLDELRHTSIFVNNKKKRLLDEVDLISSVSGGSFTSAYYGLFGDKIFEDFDKKFLKKPIQSDLIKLSLLSPKVWIRLLPGVFERSDLAAEYYNRTIFKKKTFADFRKDAPYIIINSTDLSLGQGFAFTDYYFSWICSDLKTYPVARAVAASTAVPILLSPITLLNHASKCNRAPTLWSSLDKRNKEEKRYEQSLKIKNYRDDKNLKYLHLVDGGIADNLGIRSILDLVTYHGNNMWGLLNTFKMQNTKRFVFIVVNASGFKNTEISKTRASPSSLNILDATTSIQLEKYNVETLDLLRNKFPQWQDQIIKGRCKGNPSATCKNIKFDLIEVNLQDASQQDKRELLDVPTSLELPTNIVDKLKEVGGSLLRNSKSYQTLLRHYRAK